MVDIILGSIFSVLAVIIFFRTQQYPKFNLMEGLGPGFMPRLLVIILFVLSIVLIITGIINKKKEVKTENTASKDDISVVFAPIILLSSIFAYLVLLRLLGFLITTPFLLFITMKVMRAKTKESILIAIVLTVVIYALFHFGFQVALPTGLLF